MPEVALDHVRLGRAVSLAADLHSGQTRKGTSVPYLSHLFAVSALVLEDGGGEDQAIAALLHDAAEDQGGEETLELIAELFGSRVASIVRDCSDSLTADPEEKAPWVDRKQASLDKLGSVNQDALLVIAADKLHNLRSTVADLRTVGDEVWSRFKTGRDGFLWYHQEMLDRLGTLMADSRSVTEMRSLMMELGTG